METIRGVTVVSIQVDSIQIQVDSIQLNLHARSRGRGSGARAPLEIFRFELNFAAKEEFCLL